MATTSTSTRTDVSVENVVLTEVTATLTNVSPELEQMDQNHQDPSGRPLSVIPLRGTRMTIGRALTNRVVISDMQLSRHHVCLEYRSNVGKWFLNDTSTNGITINVTRCQKFQWTELRDGDIVQLVPTIHFKITYLSLRNTNNSAISLTKIPVNATERRKLGPVKHNESIVPRQTAPGVVEIEPKIEVIELDDDSDRDPEPTLHTLPSMPTHTDWKELDSFKQKCEALEAEKTAERLMFETTLKEKEAEKEVLCKKILKIIKSEFGCSICSDVFIEAIILGCGHTFCSSCITDWFQKKLDCPTCRKTIIAKSNHIELRNFLNQIYEVMPENVKMKRNESIQERQTATQNKITTVDACGGLNNLLVEFNNFILAFGNRGGTVQSEGIQRAGLNSRNNAIDTAESPTQRLRPRVLSRRRSVRPRVPPARRTLTDLGNQRPENPGSARPPQAVP